MSDDGLFSSIVVQPTAVPTPMADNCINYGVTQVGNRPGSWSVEGQGNQRFGCTAVHHGRCFCRPSVKIPSSLRPSHTGPWFRLRYVQRSGYNRLCRREAQGPSSSRLTCERKLWMVSWLSEAVLMVSNPTFWQAWDHQGYDESHRWVEAWRRETISFVILGSANGQPPNSWYFIRITPRIQIGVWGVASCSWPSMALSLGRPQRRSGQDDPNTQSWEMWSTPLASSCDRPMVVWWPSLLYVLRW